MAHRKKGPMMSGDIADNVHDARSSAVNSNSAGQVSGHAVQAQSIYGDVHFNIGTGPAHLPAGQGPAQLPTPELLVGRAEEMARLHRMAEQVTPDGPPVLVAITGLGGVGKTALGLQWLHQLRPKFPDGQLFINLGGFSGNPLTPREALERLLRSLGVAPENMPMTVDEQAALFRSLSTGRRMIVFLDNAASAAQVRPLLPGPGPTLVVVTARRRLPGLVLSGAHCLELEPLDQAGALQLLRHMLGAERVTAEPDQARALVELCGRLPLALCASGARLVTRSRWPVARLVRELADEGRRLETLSKEDDISVRAAFDVSYRALPHEAARLYRYLGQHPGPDFGVGLAGAVLDVEADKAADLLDVLVSSNLIEEGPDYRFHFHDLLRLHAHDKLIETESESDRQSSITRMLDWYLDVAVSADIVVNPNRWRIGPRFSGEPAVTFHSSAEALHFLETELHNFEAIIRRSYEWRRYSFVWQLCEALLGLFVHRRLFHSWTATHRLGVEAARACGERTAEARMRSLLGHAYLSYGDYAAAIEHCEAALQMERELNHRRGEASVLECLGVALLATDRPQRAMDLFRRARAIHEELGRPRGAALMTRRIGEAHSAAKQYAEAISDFRSALTFFTGQAEPYHHAVTLRLIGETHLAAERPDLAAEPLQTSLRLLGEFGDPGQQAGVHVALARLAASRGDEVGERDHLREALTIYEEIGAPEAVEIRARLNRPLSCSPDAPPDRSERP